MPDEMVSTRRAVTHTVVSALVVTLLAVPTAVVWTASLARDRARAAAEAAATAVVETVVQPLATPALVAGDPAAVSRLRQAVGARIRDGATVGDGQPALVLPAAAVAAGALTLLLAVQVPQTVRLTRRLQRQEQAQRRLAERMVAVRREERLRLGAGVRDGVLQDLAGVGYLLDAVGPDLPDDGTRELLARAGEVLRGDLAVLRELAHGEVPAPRTPPDTSRRREPRAGGPGGVSRPGRDGAPGPRP